MFNIQNSLQFSLWLTCIWWMEILQRVIIPSFLCGSIMLNKLYANAKVMTMFSHVTFKIHLLLGGGIICKSGIGAINP